MSRNSFRLGIASALTVALAATTAACGGDGNESTSGKKAELRMLVNVTPNLTEKFWNDLVAPFEKANPDIDVKIQAPVATGVQDSLKQLLAAGNAPDVIEHQMPNKDLQPLLLDLSDQEFATEGPMADLYTLDGKYYMAAVGQQLQTIMFYNKAAFADAGIDAPPTTLDELEEDLAKLKEAGWTPIQTGGEWFTGLGLAYSGIPTVQGEHPDWYTSMNAGEMTWSETWGPIADRYARWVEKGYVPKDAVSTKYADAEAQFLAGESAIYPMGSWFAAAAKAAADAPEIGVFVAPAEEGVSAPVVASGAAAPYSILKDTKHKAAALELVEWLTTDKDAVAAQLAVDSNFRPGYSYETDALGQELQAIMDATPAESFGPPTGGVGDQMAPEGYSAELNTLVQGLLLDHDADKLKKAMDEWWKSNI
jgi:ABC-type glycerol-3-phosphate transport system substrate-binding protein